MIVRTSLRRTLAGFLVSTFLSTGKIMAMAATQMTARETLVTARETLVTATSIEIAFPPASVRIVFAPWMNVSALMMQKNGELKSKKKTGSTASMIQELYASVESLLIGKSHASVQDSLTQEVHVSVAR